MKTDAQIKKAIMRRVYVVYWVRQLMKPQTRLVALAAIVAGVASSVSLPDIIANATHTSDLVGFSVAAVSHTTLAIQASAFVIACIVLWSLYELFRPREMQFS